MTAALAGALEMMIQAYEELDDAALLEEASDDTARDPRYLGAKAILAEYYAGAPAEPLTCSLDALSSELSALAAKLQQAEEGN
jgi:hypothetical protein